MNNLLSPKVAQAAYEATMEVGSWEVAADFCPYVTFASGKVANNKLDMEKPIGDEQPEDVREALLLPMDTLTSLYRPDAVWGVPSGGQHYAIESGRRLQLPVIHLKKVLNEAGLKTFDFLSEEDEERAARARRIVGHEDAGSERTSLHGALYESERLKGLARKTVGIVIAWQRGRIADTRKLHVEPVAVVQRHIPNVITPSDAFYQSNEKYIVVRESNK